MPSRLRAALRAEHALTAVLAGGLLLMLALNLPGQLSVDSVLQLHEGRTGVRDTFGPAIYARILGGFDAIQPGAGLYVTVSGSVLFASLLSLRFLRGRVSWLCVPVALAMVLSPTLLIYQGIVWKDVLFANLAAAGFVCLAFAAQAWSDRPFRWLVLLAALILFALAALLRQNGLIAVVLAALALAWTVRSGGWPSSLAWGVGGLAAILLASAGLNAAASFRAEDPDRAMGVGMRILQHYDLVAAASIDPSYRFDAIDKVRPQNDDFIKAVADQAYSPQRVDRMEQAPTLIRRMFKTPRDAIQAEWRNLVLRQTDTYLAHRADAFRWVFLTPDLQACLPQHYGVAGPPDKLADLGLTAGAEPRHLALLRYGERFYGTPFFSHLAFAGLAVLVAGLLLLRRDPADWVMIAMLASALGFAASFFVISLACDYRYLYYLDLAAMVGVLYLAIDPRLRASAPLPKVAK